MNGPAREGLVRARGAPVCGNRVTRWPGFSNLPVQVANPGQGNEQDVDPELGDIILARLADLLGPVEVTATGAPPYQVHASVSPGSFSVAIQTDIGRPGGHTGRIATNSENSPLTGTI